MTQPRRYIAVADGFLMVLRQGDDVFASLEALMRDERIASASIRGFGFVRTARFGYFDFAAVIMIRESSPISRSQV